MINVWGLTDIGLVRKENQDAYAVRMNDESGHLICVVCDGMGGAKGGRIASTMAVSMFLNSCLANLRARGFKKDKWIYEIAEHVIKPDIAFFLDVPADLAIERVRSRPHEKDKYIDIDLQYKLRNEYIDICKKNGGILISSTSSPDKTYEQVWKAVEKFLEEAK